MGRVDDLINSEDMTVEELEELAMLISKTGDSSTRELEIELSIYKKLGKIRSRKIQELEAKLNDTSNLVEAICKATIDWFKKTIATSIQDPIDPARYAYTEEAIRALSTALEIFEEIRENES